MSLFLTAFILSGVSALVCLVIQTTSSNSEEEIFYEKRDKQDILERRQAIVNKYYKKYKQG